MGTLNKNLLFFVITLLTFTTTNNLLAQTIQQKNLINEYSIQANKLIWHLNDNTKNLRNYQFGLNEWYLSEEAVSNAPVFQFSPNAYIKNIEFLISEQKIDPSNPSFNYQKSLEKLHNQILVYNELSLQLNTLSKTITKKEYYKKSMVLLYQIDDMAEELVNLSYNFSLSCAINYGKENLPIELERLKTTVGQSKNVIMAIRDNSPVQVKSYLNQLNNDIIASSKDIDFSNLKRLGRFYLSESELKVKHDKILSAANKIAYWGEQYLQSSLDLKEVMPILEESILAFNVFEGEAGCAATYNEMVANSKNQYLFFTEEPMFFEVKEQELLVKETELGEIKKPVVVVPTKKEDTVKTTKPVVEKPVIVKAPVFDENDLTTLDGALPNNIIIMMDVSASMKLTGKLPLLKSSITHLLDIMRPEDRLSLIAYSGEAELLIGGASIKNRAEVKGVLDTLHSSGGTDIENGVTMAYQTAEKSLMKNGNNRIIIATDGEFGVRAPLLKIVNDHALSGVYLSVFQFNDSNKSPRNTNLKTLADTGKGSYRTITSTEQALKELMLEVKKK